MATPLTNGSINVAAKKVVSHTITGLKRWSCGVRELPAISQIKAVHVYDFDNTLFMSPLPNPRLWTPQSVGFLQAQDSFANGGWWHDQHILEATGGGVEIEEPLAWQGWWNEHIVSLVTLSMAQNDALTVLLTGRGEKNFADLISRMVASKKLDFDLICLKPRAGPTNQQFRSTMIFKQTLLKDLIHTYKDADEIRVYEDRQQHTKAFRQFFESFNKMVLSPSEPTPRKPIAAEVIQVAELMTNLGPVVETAEVQRMINAHNLAIRAGTTNHNRGLEIKKQIHYTGYLISPADTAKLLTLINLPSGILESGINFLANNILITQRQSNASDLEKVGGMGHKQTWQVTGIAVYESKIWAARVAPVPPSSNYYTDRPSPIVILAHVKTARLTDANNIQQWESVASEKQYVFQTEVGEKVQLHIEREGAPGNQHKNPYANQERKRKHTGPEDTQQDRDVSSRLNQGPSQHQRFSYGNDENRRPGAGGNHGASYRIAPQNRGRGGSSGNSGERHGYPPHNGGRGGRSGNGGGGRGGNRGGGGGNRGRGRGGYKSLDDVGGSATGRYGGNQGSGYQHSQQQPNYDDAPAHGAGDTYNATFPPLGNASGGGGREYHSGMNGGGGLPYGQ